MGEGVKKSPLQEILSLGKKEYLLNGNNHSVFVLDSPNSIRVKYENGQLNIGPRAVLEKLNLLDFIADNKQAIIDEIKQVEEAFEDFRRSKRDNYYYSFLAEAEYYKSGFDIQGINRVKMEMLNG